MSFDTFKKRKKMKKWLVLLMIIISICFDLYAENKVYPDGNAVDTNVVDAKSLSKIQEDNGDVTGIFITTTEKQNDKKVKLWQYYQELYSEVPKGDVRVERYAVILPSQIAYAISRESSAGMGGRRAPNLNEGDYPLYIFLRPEGIQKLQNINLNADQQLAIVLDDVFYGYLDIIENKGKGKLALRGLKSRGVDLYIAVKINSRIMADWNQYGQMPDENDSFRRKVEESVRESIVADMKAGFPSGLGQEVDYKTFVRMEQCGAKLYSEILGSNDCPNPVKSLHSFAISAFDKVRGDASGAGTFYKYLLMHCPNKDVKTVAAYYLVQNSSLENLAELLNYEHPAVILHSFRKLVAYDRDRIRTKLKQFRSRSFRTSISSMERRPETDVNILEIKFDNAKVAESLWSFIETPVDIPGFEIKRESVYQLLPDVNYPTVADWIYNRLTGSTETTVEPNEFEPAIAALMIMDELERAGQILMATEYVSEQFICDFISQLSYTKTQADVKLLIKMAQAVRNKQWSVDDQISSRIVRALVQFGGTDRGGVRWIQENKFPEIRQELYHWLDGPERKEILQVLAQKPLESEKQYFIEALSDEDMFICRTGIEGLKKIGHSDVIEHLIAVMDRKDALTDFYPFARNLSGEERMATVYPPKEWANLAYEADSAIIALASKTVSGEYKSSGFGNEQILIERKKYWQDWLNENRNLVYKY
jgi:hypothetical protein